MASTNGGHYLTRSDDDTHDHIGSLSATPSGVATPRPDPSDKRLPGIMHGYFGQVGTTSYTSPSGMDRCALVTPALEQSITNHIPEHHRSTEDASTALSTAPSSPTQCVQDGDGRAVQVVAPALLDVPQVGSVPDMPRNCAYPTPPVSSPPSLHAENDGGINSGSKSRVVEGGAASSLMLGRQLSATDLFSLGTRRHTTGLKSLSAIMTDSTVYAAHISNPTSAHFATMPSTPTYEHLHASALTSLTSHLEQIKLTENVALSPRQKNTPPLTPRALSTEGSDTVTKDNAPTSNPTQSPPDDAHFSAQQHGLMKSNGSATLAVPTSSPPVGPPRGKLSVKIAEARGLRPSYDPYVVCVFEWNEYISKGPKRDDSDMEKDESKGKDEAFKAVPIKRSGSDMGRSMAIPMKSRQSSTTSLSDQKNFKSGRQVTDPRWEHEVVL